MRILRGSKLGETVYPRSRHFLGSAQLWSIHISILYTVYSIVFGQSCISIYSAGFHSPASPLHSTLNFYLQGSKFICYRSVAHPLQHRCSWSPSQLSLSSFLLAGLFLLVGMILLWEPSHFFCRVRKGFIRLFCSSIFIQTSSFVIFPSKFWGRRFWKRDGGSLQGGREGGEWKVESAYLSNHYGKSSSPPLAVTYAGEPSLTEP